MMVLVLVEEEMMVLVIVDDEMMVGDHLIHPKSETFDYYSLSTSFKHTWTYS